MIFAAAVNIIFLGKIVILTNPVWLVFKFDSYLVIEFVEKINFTSSFSMGFLLWLK
jgi:hypothetical protein